MYEYLLPIDLGRFQDYSAIHLIKIVPVSKSNKFNPKEVMWYNTYHVIWQERTTEKYTALVKRVDMILSQPRFAENTAVIVDATGVGSAVVEMFEHNPIAISIHGGDMVSIREDPPGYNVPKRDIIGAMQVVLQTGRLKIKKDLPYNDQLIRELQNFTMKISAAGSDLYENLKSSIHDDMVISLGLGLWYGEKFIKYDLAEHSTAPGYDPLA